MSPRRAAKAASANIAKQLDSSDSDDEEHYGARVPTGKKRRFSSASSRFRAKAHIAAAAGSSPRSPRPLSAKGVTPRPRKRPLASSASDIEDLTREPLTQPFPVFKESPARKKQKWPLTDTEDHHSRPLSVRNAEDVDEELPDPTSAFSRMNYSVGATYSTEGTTPETLLDGSVDTEDTYEERFWEPPEADPCIEIPGEPILAQTKKGDVYWPAKVLDYIPPRKRNEEGKYRVLFLDNAERCIHRARFYIAEDDEFGTCKLGQFTSQFNEVEADEDFVASPIQQTGHRPSSPVPADPPPSSSEFYELSIHEQLSYTKPILQAILMGTYIPAAERHNGFIAGGNARDIVMQNAAMRGDMDPKDVSELQNRLMEWCLRYERYARRTEVDAVVLTEPPLKPQSRQDAPKPSLSQEGPPSDAKTSTAVDREASPAVTLASTPSTEPPSQLSVVSTIETVHIEDPRKSFLDVVTHTDPPRQRGCPQYEALSAREKIEYCLNVLLPESIIQIFLWKSGDRKSISLQSPDEEAALHTVGEEMRAKRDWVFDVMRLRDMHEHQRGVKRKRPVPENDAVVEGTGTRTRLRTRKSIS